MKESTTKPDNNTVKEGAIRYIDNEKDFNGPDGIPEDILNIMESAEFHQQQDAEETEPDARAKLLDGLDNEISTHAMKLKEWYGWHFPELHRFVADNAQYSRLVLECGMRSNYAERDLSSILVDESLRAAVKEAAVASVGTEISDADAIGIRSLAEKVLSMTESRAQLLEHHKQGTNHGSTEGMELYYHSTGSIRERVLNVRSTEAEEPHSTSATEDMSEKRKHMAQYEHELEQYYNGADGVPEDVLNVISSEAEEPHSTSATKEISEKQKHVAQLKHEIEPLDHPPMMQLKDTIINEASDHLRRNDENSTLCRGKDRFDTTSGVQPGAVRMGNRQLSALSTFTDMSEQINDPSSIQRAEDGVIHLQAEVVDEQREREEREELHALRQRVGEQQQNTNVLSSTSNSAVDIPPEGTDVEVVWMSKEDEKSTSNVDDKYRAEGMPKRIVYLIVVLIMCCVMVFGVALVAVAVVHYQNRDTPTPPDTPTPQETPSPQGNPTTQAWEGGCFQTRAQLDTAINVYIENPTNPYDPIGEWCFDDITDFSRLFEGREDFNEDISSWDVSQVTNMEEMFKEAKRFNQNLSRWNVSRVMTMEGMFWKARNFNQDLSGWNVWRVTNMKGMFDKAGRFDGNVTTWDVSKVTEMRDMFYGCTNFNKDISGWNVSNVKDTERMFKDATNFNQDLCAWKSMLVDDDTDVKEMFEGSGCDVTAEPVLQIGPFCKNCEL